MTPEERESLRQRLFAGDKVDHEALRLLAEEGLRERRDHDFEKAIELWMAGWTSHPVRKKSEIMAWYWRRPPIPPRKKGRLYLSTDQALNALRKEKNGQV